MKKVQSQKIIRKRKMLLVLPLLIIPFLTMAFWALGGGKGSSNDKLAKDTNGLNLKLPDATLKDDHNADKLSFYTEAMADSLKRAEALRNDPYYKDAMSEKQNALLLSRGNFPDNENQHTGLNYSPYNKTTDENEAKIYQKINELNKQINQPDNTIAANKYAGAYNQSDDNKEQFSSQVDRLESMMQSMNNKQEADPEMQQLNGTLEKILDIQHPDRVKEKIKATSLKKKTAIFGVSKDAYTSTVSLLDTSGQENAAIRTNGFYGLNNEEAISSEPAAIEAVIHETQTLVNGAVVKMRLLNDVFVNGHLIPANNFVYGIATLNKERLEIVVNNIRDDHALFSVKLEVVDMDGLTGIYTPGSITNEAVKQSSNDALQSVALGSIDPSIGAQAATAGIETVKNLLSKKIRLIKITVKAGYKILLKDNNQQ